MYTFRNLKKKTENKERAVVNLKIKIWLDSSRQ